MPVADFFGRWNWGYDGVLLYAPDSAYGRPDDLKALVDAAHARGLMVFLDVVYNHFGPEGNYLGRYAPQFFTPAQTPWGNAIDYERPEVRRFAVENALHWLSEYRFDGLRLDAVHAIAEPGRSHAASRDERGGRHAGLADRAPHPPCAGERRQPGEPARSAHRSAARQVSRAVERRLSPRLPCAADRRDAGLLRRLPRRRAACGAGARGGLCLPGRAVAASRRRGARREHGEPARHGVRQFPAEPRPDRQPRARRAADALAKPEALEAALAITLLAPGPPLLFMGEQWGAREPFPFFCDFKGELAEAVRKGRRKEFRDAYVQHGDEVPDPLSEQTVRLATLDWTAAEQAGAPGAARTGDAAAGGAARVRHAAPAATAAGPRPCRVRRWRADGGLVLALGRDAVDRRQSHRPAAAAPAVVSCKAKPFGETSRRPSFRPGRCMRRSQARDAWTRRSPPIGCS